MKHEPSSGKPAIIPTKRLGQNFLKDSRIVNRIVDALAPSLTETIIEIGPGTGALTSVLVERAGRVVAVEFDRQLVPLLEESLGKHEKFKLVHADALEADFCAEILPAQNARLVANLPYNISTAILQHLIVQRRCIREMVLMLQKEVVDRILAPAGSSDRGYLSVLVEAYCETEKLFDVAPSSFRPVPKVWSSVLKLNFRTELEFQVHREELLWSVVSAGFAQKRKTILNNLRNTTGALKERIQDNGGASIVLCKAGIDVQRRAETLTIEEWGKITKALQ
jgi:16S rRNA (adenine1518-N6/adenine1519-N6)-dimethyltransferase